VRDFGGGEVFEDRAKRAREAWKSTVDALAIGTKITGVVVNRQPFGVFINIDGHPDAMGLAETTQFPGAAELPAPGTLISGEVVWLAEHNHQVRIRPTTAPLYSNEIQQPRQASSGVANPEDSR
jgi:hypothetical protein